MRRTRPVLLVLVVLAITRCVTNGGTDDDRGAAGYVPGEELAGGATTTTDLGENAFNHPATNLTTEEQSRFVVGNSFFRSNWVTAPASTQGRDGLGPLFNARSCSGCHLRDGRGRPPEHDEEISGLLFRLSVPGSGPHGAPVPHPVYGSQLQPFAIAGVAGEGHMRTTYTTSTGSFRDGTPYELQRPEHRFLGGPYGPLENTLISARVAQQLCGMGLLEAIPEDVVRANAHDTTDGISGRPNQVFDVTKGGLALGRFGWKANEPTVMQQMAAAFNGDIGITSPLFPEDHCTAAQPACAAAVNGNAPGEDQELGRDILEQVAFYTSTLGVPVRRDARSPEVLQGKAIFHAIGCASCHRPTYTTGPSAISQALAGQIIHPYTDLLLHDMGPGLADGRPDFLADGQEWRTPPLWGIGLFQTTNGHTRYLHDGRARDLNEAILWHGGEAAPAQERYLDLSADERQALLTFLRSL